MKGSLLGILFLAASTIAMAGPAEDAEVAHLVAQIQLKTCKLAYELFEGGGADPTEGYKAFLGCKSKGLKEAKAAYSSLLPKLKRADARKALKDYQVALMGSFEGIERKNGETRGLYVARLAALESALEAAWSRLQIEM